MNVSPFQIWQSRQAAKQVLLPLMRLPAPIWMAVPSVPIRNIIPILMRFMQRYTTSMQLTLFLRLHSLIFLPILVQQQKRVILPSISQLLALARMVVLKICVKRLRFWRVIKSILAFVALLFLRLSRCIVNALKKVWWIFSWMQIAQFLLLPAVLAWAAIWVFWQLENVLLLPQTAIL